MRQTIVTRIMAGLMIPAAAYVAWVLIVIFA